MSCEAWIPIPFGPFGPLIVNKSDATAAFVNKNTAKELVWLVPKTVYSVIGSIQHILLYTWSVEKCCWISIFSNRTHPHWIWDRLHSPNIDRRIDETNDMSMIWVFHKMVWNTQNHWCSFETKWPMLPMFDDFGVTSFRKRNHRQPSMGSINPWATGLTKPGRASDRCVCPHQSPQPGRDDLGCWEAWDETAQFTQVTPWFLLWIIAAKALLSR